MVLISFSCKIMKCFLLKAHRARSASSALQVSGSFSKGWVYKVATSPWASKSICFSCEFHGLFLGNSKFLPAFQGLHLRSVCLVLQPWQATNNRQLEKNGNLAEDMMTQKHSKNHQILMLVPWNVSHHAMKSKYKQVLDT